MTVDAAPPRILYVVSEDWYFLSHRLPMARAARAAGFEVHVATNVVDGAAAIGAEGFTLHRIPSSRGRVSLPLALQVVQALRRIHRSVAPAIVHHVSLQMSVLGSLAAMGTSAARINAITGFGFMFSSDTAKARTLRIVVGSLVRHLLAGRNAVALVQNPDDRQTLLDLGVSPDRVALIPGSGVDVERLTPLPVPQGPPAVGFAGRLLEDKGIRALVEAHRLLRRQGTNTPLLIAGTPDPANPASVTQQEAQSWGREVGVTLLGHVKDIETLWARASIAVLPSRREGLPKALLEAAAFGRPMIAADVPGCREVVIPDDTGILVPVDDAPALADAIARLASAPELCERYGRAARSLVVARFSADAIGRATVDLYRRLLPQHDRPEA
jgi:glycosyltransferase involved in cell wall biosynthesis